MSYPEAEISITQSLVRQLIDTQFPEFSGLSLKFLASGFDNAIYRLGASYLVRLPRRGLGATLLEHEAAWLGKLTNILPLRIPAPIKVGAPSEHYPWKWTIVPWFEGNRASDENLKVSEAGKFADFLKALHGVDPSGAPENPYRDVPLSARADYLQERISQIESKGLEISSSIKKQWEKAVEEKNDCPRSLIHGDLHPFNMIVKNGEIEAIIDWGDITGGDPATDLASFWMLVDDQEIRKKALHQYGASEATITRAKGWAVFFGIIFLSIGSGYQKCGYRILNNIQNGVS